MIEIWDKNKIAILTDTEKEMWFDVYNYKLEQDRNISLSDPKLKEKQLKIKKDYFTYINSCANSEKFYKYYVLKYSKKIVSQCRINIYENKYGSRRITDT